MSNPVDNEVHLVFVDTLANSNKFWKAKAHDNGDIEVTWGRVGYNGQTKVRNCGSYSASLYELHTVSTKKKEKGYKVSALDTKSVEIQLVLRALELLQRLKNYDNDRIATINEYLSLVPTPLGMKLDPTAILSTFPEINRHEQLLKEFLPKLEAVTVVQESTKTISLKSLSNQFWKID